MDGRQLLMAIDQVSRDKGIAVEKLIDALEIALEIAAKKKWEEEKIQVDLDRDTGEISIVTIRTVVEEVVNQKSELSLDSARQFDENAEIGDEVGELIDIEEFGRIAAQIVKQVVFQKVKEAESEIIVSDYGGRIGEVINGIVVGVERRNYLVDLGKAEGVLPYPEQVRREKYRNGDRIRAYLQDVRVTPKGAEIVLSRTNKELVRKLFEMEVPEIGEGIVEIKAVERDPGDRIKIAVYSNDSAVDPVGACVGMKGARVQAVVRELRGEKIDIISWSEDLRVFIAESMSPAEVEKVGVNPESNSAVVVVDPSQLSLAIGKKGQNVRLASRLTGWKIDVINADEFGDEGAQSVDKDGLISAKPTSGIDSVMNDNISSIPWIDSDVADLFSEKGVHSIEGIATYDVSDLTEDPEVAKRIQEVVTIAKDIQSRKGRS